MPTRTVIQTKDLIKRFGPVTAVDDLDLTVRRGEVFGYLGPNGAGKTTTIRLLLDFIRPTAGPESLLLPLGLSLALAALGIWRFGPRDLR